MLIKLVKLAFQRLREASFTAAAYNSSARHAASRCLSGTREKLLSQILQIMSNADGHGICWLYGVAGSGKSSVAQTIADHLASHGQLVASYFFSRLIPEGSDIRK